MNMDSNMERWTDIDTDMDTIMDMDLDTHMHIEMDVDTDMDVTLPRTWIWTPTRTLIPVVFKSIYNNLIRLIKLNEIIT